jgi:uncharacterized protein (DUF169 family)
MDSQHLLNRDEMNPMNDERFVPTANWAALSEALTGALHLAVPPVAITFGAEAPPGTAAFHEPMSNPAPDGRRGRVAAGCVFWIRGLEGRFSTVPADHGNCSVGSYTHGLITLEEAAGHDDVATLLEAGWVDGAALARVPSVSTRPGTITYGPLTQATEAPDVVLLRVNGRQLMVLSDALPGLRIEGKPQCHIVALAVEEDTAAASVGCALSRARTGMGPDEMTVAIPGHRLAEVTDAVMATAATDTAVAKYAAEDARRFSRSPAQ